jgi:hypothetical protein
MNNFHYGPNFKILKKIGYFLYLNQVVSESIFKILFKFLMRSENTQWKFA